MKPGIKLELTHGQHLVMTPHLQQAIKLLQLNAEELTLYLQKEMEKNPLLEVELPGYTPIPSNGITSNPANPNEIKSETLKQTANQISNSNDSISVNKEKNPDENYPYSEQEFYQSDHHLNHKGSLSHDDHNHSFDRLQLKPSLQEHVTQEINLLFQDDKDKKIAFAFLGLLEETGWLAQNWEQEMNNLGVSVESQIRVLKQLQKIEPTGIFCRNLTECLKLQLIDNGQLSPNFEVLLNNLDCFISGDEKKLLNLTGLSPHELKQHLQILRSLDPKPGLLYHFYHPIAIEPDVLVYKNSTGDWQIELNQRIMPKASVQNANFRSFLARSHNKKDKNFLNEHYYSAKWLIKSLEQRKETILKVATRIVEVQKDFLEHGIEFLKPLVLRDVAKAIEMHESTVSRVTTNKFMATPRGLLEMKFFFTQALENKNGDNPISAEVVRHHIKTIIDKEQPDDILSDDVIVKMLQTQGFDVARRTVAKYREALKIPSSVMRRKLKNSFLYRHK